MMNSEELTPIYQLGDTVVFTDERGVPCVGRVASIGDHGVQGEIGIDLLGGWSYGLYSRKVKDVRPAGFQLQNFSEK